MLFAFQNLPTHSSNLYDNMHSKQFYSCAVQKQQKAIYLTKGLSPCLQEIWVLGLYSYSVFLIYYIKIIEVGLKYTGLWIIIDNLYLLYTRDC